MDIAIGSVIVEIVKAILPFGEIAKAWGEYYKYRAKRVEVDGQIRKLRLVLPVVSEHLRARAQVELRRLENERVATEGMLAILEDQSRELRLTGEALRRALSVCNDKLVGARGEELREVRLIYEGILAFSGSKVVSLFDVMKKAMDSQMRSFENNRDSLPDDDEIRRLLGGGE